MANNRITRILLIDDDEFIVRLSSLFLTKVGYEIILTTDGNDAIRKMDGLAFLHGLRQEGNATMPIVVLTGMVTADTEQQVIADGGMALLYKPIKVPELLEKIQQIEQSI